MRRERGPHDAIDVAQGTISPLSASLARDAAVWDQPAGQQPRPLTFSPRTPDVEPQRTIPSATRNAFLFHDVIDDRTPLAFLHHAPGQQWAGAELLHRFRRHHAAVERPHPGRAKPRATDSHTRIGGAFNHSATGHRHIGSSSALVLLIKVPESAAFLPQRQMRPDRAAKDVILQRHRRLSVSMGRPAMQWKVRVHTHEHGRPHDHCEHGYRGRRQNAMSPLTKDRRLRERGGGTKPISRRSESDCAPEVRLTTRFRPSISSSPPWRAAIPIPAATQAR